MNSTKVLLLTLILGSAAVGMTAAEPVVSSRSNLKGDYYTNPVIYSDYSDPDVCASPDGTTFYMTASSFQCTPGLPILKSTDLVNWQLVNHALDSVPPADHYARGPLHGKGVWAPCIKWHDGQYYIYWGDPDFGIYMVKTDNPEGRWSAPVLVRPGKGLIDPTPLWDEDGRAYLVNGWAASRSGFNSVLTVSDLSSDGTRVTSTPRIIYDGNDGVNHTIEGPKIYKRDGSYYIFAPAGGVERGWQIVLRSDSINGPYEVRTVMAQGTSDINGPHQGAWVSTAAGEDWFLHFQDRGPYGRIIHLNPMSWREGWPVIGNDTDGDGCGEPVRRWRKPALPAARIDAADLANNAELFQWHANYNDFYGFAIPDGMMRLYGHRLSEDYVNFWEVPNLWLQKFPSEAFEWTARVRVSAKNAATGVSSGIIVMGWDYARLGLVRTADGFSIQFATCHDAEQGGAESTGTLADIKPTREYTAGKLPNAECDLYFRVKVSKDAICDFSYSTDGKQFIKAGTFKAREGKWIGAKTGFYSVTPADVHDRGWIDILNTELKILN